MKHHFVLVLLLSSSHLFTQLHPSRSNVILIYTNDLGCGDISFAGGKIPTLNVARLFKMA